MKLPELKKWLNKQSLPKELQINEHTYTNDLAFTVNALIASLEANRKNKGYLPYYDLLIEIKEKLQTI